MNGKVGMVLGIVAGVVVVGGLLYLAFTPVGDAGERGEAQSQNAGRIFADKKAKKPRFVDEAEVSDKKTDASARPNKARMAVPKDWFVDLPSATDRAIAKRIQDAQDADSREAVFAVAEEALSSQNAEVRQAAVDALSLQGEAAMQPLLKFIADKDKGVADSAYRAWDDAVDNMDGDLNKLGAIQAVLAVAKDKEHVKSAVGKIEMFDQSRAIRELAKLAKEDGAASKAAKESYENVTGEPFESWAAAELKAIAIDRDNKAVEGESE